MFSYVIPALALLLVFFNPIYRLLSPSSSQDARAALRNERPALNESLLAIPGPGDGVGCREGGFAVHVWSAEPLVIYIEGFLDEGERGELLDMRYVALSFFFSFLLFIRVLCCCVYGQFPSVCLAHSPIPHEPIIP